MATNQIKSKQRVANHGEVFTAEREVNAMLDLVKQETERIESRFLEPACGNGNFLAEILRRKLNVVKYRYGKNVDDYERYAVIAVTSIYGVELLEDNCMECRERLYKIWNDEYYKVCNKDTNEDCRSVVRYILEKNILCGNALTLEQADGKPLIFAEWSPINGTSINRRDFKFENLINSTPFVENNIFSPLGENAFIPQPVKEYPITHYLRIADAQK